MPLHLESSHKEGWVDHQRLFDMIQMVWAHVVYSVVIDLHLFLTVTSFDVFCHHFIYQILSHFKCNMHNNLFTSMDMDSIFI